MLSNIYSLLMHLIYFLLRAHQPLNTLITNASILHVFIIRLLMYSVLITFRVGNIYSDKDMKSLTTHPQSRLKRSRPLNSEKIFRIGWAISEIGGFLLCVGLSDKASCHVNAFSQQWWSSGLQPLRVFYKLKIANFLSFLVRRSLYLLQYLLPLIVSRNEWSAGKFSDWCTNHE